MPRFTIEQPGGLSVSVYIPDELLTQTVGESQYPLNQPFNEEELKRMVTLLCTNLSIMLLGTLHSPHTSEINLETILRHLQYAAMKIHENNRRSLTAR
jgi:hypothetical protein